MPRPSDEEEIFTDLRGNPDPAPGAGKDDAADLEKGLKDLAKGEDIDDDDLKIVDEDAEDEEGAAGAAAEDEEEETAEDTAANGADDFDPKDVMLLTKDSQILDTAEKTTTKDKETATADIAAALKAMKDAKESGDSDADIAATQKYTAATIAQRDADDALKVLARQKADLIERAKELYAKAPKDAEGNAILTGDRGVAKRAAAAAANPADNRPSKLTPKFKAANPWFGNSKYAEQQKTLIAIDKGLAAEGLLNKDTPEYFAEMGKRFNAKHPGLFRGLDGKPVATGQRQRGAGAPIPGASNSGGGKQPVGDQVKFTTADTVEMRRFGLDPDNMAHRRNWLAEKRSLSSARA